MPGPLLHTLDELVGCHKQLLKNSELKKQSLIAGDIDTLSQLIKEEGKIVRQLGKLEEERLYQVQEYMKRQGLVGKEVTLSQLISFVPREEDKTRLRGTAKTLQQVVGELQKNNELNAKLIEEALNYVNHSIDLFTAEDEVNYQDGSTLRKGTNDSMSNRSFFDSKA